MHNHAFQSRAIILVGFMGAGKTTVGRELARFLEWTFEDLDERIQSREKRTIEEIFRDSGESEFRRCEHHAFRELLLEEGTGSRVIALGGGAFAQAANSALIEAAGIRTIFLDAPVEELFRRCQLQPSNRPLRQTEAQFRELYEARRPLYEKAAWRIETGGKSVPNIVAAVIKALGLPDQNNFEILATEGVDRDA